MYIFKNINIIYANIYYILAVVLQTQPNKLVCLSFSEDGKTIGKIYCTKKLFINVCNERLLAKYY